MANYQYSADILDDILFRAGEQSDGTSDFHDAALRYLNRAYQAIVSGGAAIDPEIDEVWWWLRSSAPEPIILQPPIEAGTVDVTNGSTSITFSSAPAASAVGKFFRVDDEQDVFRISAHTAGQQAATLDAAYTGSTDSAAAYKLIQLEYDLSDNVYKLLPPLRVYRDAQQRIEIVDLAALEDRFPLSMLTADTPRLAAMVSDSRIRFSSYPSSAMRVDADYLQKATLLTDADDEEPLVPHEYRRVLADAALMFLFTDKMDDRAQSVGLLAKSGIVAMQKEHRRRTVKQGIKTYGRIQTRQDQISRQRGPLRTSTGLIIG